MSTESVKYVDDRFDALEKLTNEKFRSRDEAWKEHRIADERRLKLQAKENKRRFHELNNEAARLKLMKDELVSKEVHERDIEGFKKDARAFNEYKVRQEGRGTLERYIPWGIAIAAIIYNYFKR